jgi:pyruvate decarboxylase
MTHHKLTPIIFVLNNKGYNIERHLHGRDRRVITNEADHFS